MIQIQDNGIRGYHPEMDGDPLLVEKGYCHYNSNGQKDFLDRMLGYEPSETGCTFEAALELVHARMAEGLSTKDAVKQVAKLTGFAKNLLYDAVVK